MHSKQAMVLCCGISIRMFNSVATLDFQRKVLDSPVRGDGRVRIEAITKTNMLSVRSEPHDQNWRFLKVEPGFDQDLALL